METKVCNKCNIKKDVTEFYSGRKKCKLCYCEYSKEYYKNNKEKKKKYDKEYRKSNREIILIKKKEYYEKNKEYHNKMGKIYYNKNKDKVRKYKKTYYEENKEKFKVNGKRWRDNNNEKIKVDGKRWRDNNKEKLKRYHKEYKKNRCKSDPLFSLKLSIRNRIYNSLNIKGYKKKSNTYTILGCSYEEFKLHIESQFEDWMNWDNYGIYNGKEKCGWDYDHIVPVSSAQCEEDIYRLNHYSNIQPLCSYINRCVKRDNIDWES